MVFGGVFVVAVNFEEADLAGKLFSVKLHMDPFRLGNLGTFLTFLL